MVEKILPLRKIAAAQLAADVSTASKHLDL
jgi:hypothetical protein